MMRMDVGGGCRWVVYFKNLFNCWPTKSIRSATPSCPRIVKYGCNIGSNKVRVNLSDLESYLTLFLTCARFFTDTWLSLEPRSWKLPYQQMEFSDIWGNMVFENSESYERGTRDTRGKKYDTSLIKYFSTVGSCNFSNYVEESYPFYDSF